MNQQDRRFRAPHERAATRADALARPPRRDADDDEGRRLDRRQERLLGRLRQHRLDVDARDALHGERRVGEQAARVAPAAPRVGPGADQPERRGRRKCEPGAELHSRPVVRPAAEGDEDAAPGPAVAPARRDGNIGG